MNVQAIVDKYYVFSGKFNANSFRMQAFLQSHISALIQYVIKTDKKFNETAMFAAAAAAAIRIRYFNRF